MLEASLHIPVMLDEVICALAPADNGLFIDATFGNGGYSRAILSSAACSVAAIDRDPDAILRGQELIDASNDRLSLHRGPLLADGRDDGKHLVF
jgi:16S rRNA (cytosine1402-N4)-methyltransferase